MNIYLALCLIVLLLLVNAFFVSAEFAIMAVRRSQIEPLVAEGVKGAKDALWTLEHVSTSLSCAQLGVTVVSTGLGVVAEPALAHFFEAPLLSWGLPAGTSHIAGFILALLIVICLHVILGEIVPKNISVSAPDKAVLILAPALVKVIRILRPAVVALDCISNFFLRMVKVDPKSTVSATYTVEEVANIIEVSQAEGILEDELGLLSGAIEFSEETVRDVMVLPGDLVTVLPDTTPNEIEQLVAKTGFSRFPVVIHGQIENYIHLKDVLYAKADTRNEPLPVGKLREMPEVNPDDEIEEALQHMQKSGDHLAKVISGDRLLGVVFLEDIIEKLVGEIGDSLHREANN